MKGSKMKVKEMTIKIRSTSEVLNEFKDTFTAISQGKKVKPKISISFENLDVMRKTLTENRLHLLKVIKKEKPDSIYALAKLTGRDFKNVYDDIKILKDFWLVDLTKDKKNKKRLKPSLLYSGLNLHFSF